MNKFILRSFLFLSLLAPAFAADNPNDNYIFNRIWSIMQTGVPVVSTASTTTTVSSTALEASKVLKNSAGYLSSVSIYNSKATAQFILIMNSATVPADGAVTLLYPPIAIAAQTTVMIAFPIPLTASTGIAICNSSTGTFTKTIGSADCAFTAQVQ